METLLGYYQQYMSFANSNPIFGSAVFMSVFGGIIMLLKDHMLSIPATLWRYISRFIYCEIVIRSDSRWNDSDSYMYDAFLCWYSTTRFYKTFVKSFKMSSQWVDGRRLYLQQAGLGIHWFMYKGRLGFVSLSEETNQNTIYRVMHIRYFGKAAHLTELRDKSHEHLEAMNSDGRLAVYEPGDSEWRRVSHIRARDLSSVIIAGTTLKDITDKIDQFLASEQWYIDRGIPYKLIIVLEGPPGTGKSSLIRALAHRYRRSLYKADMSAVCRHLKTVGENALVYVEDFDDDQSSHSRGPIKTDENPMMSDTPNTPAMDVKVAESSMVRRFFGEGLADILNAMDGMLTPHGLIMLMTTNHIEKIDQAILRDERVDEIYHIGYLKHDDVCRYIHRFYEGATVPDGIHFDPIPGSKLQKFLKANPTVDGFIQAVLEHQRLRLAA